MEQSIASLGNEELLAVTRNLVKGSCAIEADLLLHLAEIDARGLYHSRGYPSMYAFCIGEFGFSESAAFKRIGVARASRAYPKILDAVRSGSVHLSGLLVLIPHLTQENHEDLLARAAGRTREAISGMVAAIAPWSAPCMSARRMRAPSLVPVSEESYFLQASVSREGRDALQEAQDLLRHQIPDGDLGAIIEKAAKLLVDTLKKKRFAVGRKARKSPEGSVETESRHIPDAVKRAVYERDGGQCTFVGENGKRCESTGPLEFNHDEGFALTHEHDVDKIHLMCRAHNQHLADRMYGRAFMEAARQSARPGASAAGPPAARA